ncbi:uncharacterized protein MAM_07238 [Metarhizium album ARSEF 1941]|uniref:Uncharacterized protein n=1 Tax=Metarhizium album (strain ARSEF 1941) TaxID=1081103 RepID=A0A0B2WMD2_METAS|nr:uncharacterized protein MAM_07238 [Metarhizium album ARSEF 1941]KHN94819.1 hypothetical protein MAM_07238 [Metarhizium album ARSEF 1941]
MSGVPTRQAQLQPNSHGDSSDPTEMELPETPSDPASRQTEQLTVFVAADEHRCNGGRLHFVALPPREGKRYASPPSLPPGPASASTPDA